VRNNITSLLCKIYFVRFTIDASHECTEYILEHNYTIGCRIHLKSPEQRFETLEATVFTEGNHTIKTHFDSLQRNGKKTNRFAV